MWRPLKVIEIIRLHREYPSAVEAELINRGFRWRDVGTKRFTWGDLVAVIESISWDSPIRRAMDPEFFHFGNPEYALLADIRDFLGVIAVKTPTPKGMSKKHLPEPVPRPGDESKNKKVYKAEPVSFAQLDQEINW